MHFIVTYKSSDLKRPNWIKQTHIHTNLHFNSFKKEPTTSFHFLHPFSFSSAGIFQNLNNIEKQKQQQQNGSHCYNHPRVQRTHSDQRQSAANRQLQRHMVDIFKLLLHFVCSLKCTLLFCYTNNIGVGRVKKLSKRPAFFLNSKAS